MSALACGSPSPKRVNLYPITETVLPIQTPHVIIWTQTPNATMTPLVILIIVPPTPNALLCVTASDTVYLRPTPNTDNYPIVELHNAERLTDLGGRYDDWVFVGVSSYRGWVNDDYLGRC